jgi:hypothetical protein
VQYHNYFTQQLSVVYSILNLYNMII